MMDLGTCKTEGTAWALDVMAQYQDLFQRWAARWVTQCLMFNGGRAGKV